MSLHSQQKNKLVAKYQHKVLAYQELFLKEQFQSQQDVNNQSFQDLANKKQTFTSSTPSPPFRVATLPSQSSQTRSIRQALAGTVGIYPEMLSPEMTKLLLAQIARRSLPSKF